MSIRRPVRGETDDDLLKLQEDFLSKKEKPSVNIKIAVNPSIGKRENVEHATIPGKSLSSSKSTEGEAAGGSGGNTCPSSQLKIDPSAKLIPTPKWMSDPQSVPNLSSATTINANSKVLDKELPKKKSLFALRMEKSRADAKKGTEPRLAGDVEGASSKRFGDHSYIISGKEAEEIHQQNVAQLESMSIIDIEQEQQRLKSQLSSSTIKFLMSRRKVIKTSEPKTEEEKMSDVKSGPSQAKDTSTTKIHVQLAGRKKVFSNSLTSTQINEELQPSDLLATLPINPNEAKQWLHMDVVEKDKLEWMKDLPAAEKSPGRDEPYAARFDFEGLLLPYNDEKLDVNRGLHHHGDEPERPGYTLQELMQLSRSSVQQQRVMGLKTIGNILLKTKLGIYDKVLQQSCIKELLDAGLFLLLRFSMDDVSPPVVFAALTAMRNLLFNDPDEASIDYLLGCEGGLQHPLLDVPYEESDAKKIQEQIDHEAELKDFELIQLDVLKGAERTNLILRLGYILDVMKGPPDVVLDLLVRIARHSRHLAEEVASCGGLLRTIRDQLLTTHVIPSLAAGSGQSGYGEPSSKALRLIRVLAAQSRTLANTLLDKFNIMEPVMTYISMSSPNLPHMQGLVVHGFYLWQTFMSYGLASQSISDLFPILMRQVHFHVQLTSAVGEGSSPSAHELATALAGVVERACEIVSCDDNALEAKPIFQLASLFVDCAQKWLAQLSSDFAEIPTWSCVKMIGATLNCLGSTLLCAKNRGFADSRNFLEKVESFFHRTALLFLKSSYLQNLLESLLSSSYFLSNFETGYLRDPPNLPSLGAMEWGGENLVPCVLTKAPHPLLSGLLRFLAVSHEVFSSSSDKLQLILLTNSALYNYIQAIVSKPLRSSSHWFCRQEVYMLHHLLVLIVLQPSLVPDEHKAKYGQLALTVMDLIQANDKYLISQLLPITIFNADFIRWSMNLPSVKNDAVKSLVEECLLRLSAIGPLYLNMLGVRFLKAVPPSLRSSLTSQSKGTEPALPVDWHFAPLLILYGQYNAQSRARCLEGDTTSVVAETLQFLFLTETLWPNSRRHLSVTARWCRLALVFLAGSDLFLDDQVKKYLRMNLNQLLLQHNKLNFSESVPGLSSFYDLYGELLLQYSAVSYGDTLFGAFLLLPLQQKQDPQLRKMIWGENAFVLHLLPTPIEQVGVPLEEFLSPIETDPSLLSSYLEAIAKGQVVERRCPILYKVALHHVSTFIKLHKEHPVAISLQRTIDHIGKKEMQELFLNYQSLTS